MAFDKYSKINYSDHFSFIDINKVTESNDIVFKERMEIISDLV